MNVKKNNEQRFEELIADLAISDHVEKIYREGIFHLFSLIKGKFSGGMYFSPYSLYKMPESIILSDPFYGGSFDRHTNIRGISDIDVYFIYSLTDYRHYLGLAAFSEGVIKSQLRIADITGELLLNKLISQLRKIIESSIMYGGYNSPAINIKKNPPYRHAIPIGVKYKGFPFNVDCIPTIKVNNENDLIIPNFNSITKINPTKDENALSKINKKHHGKPTKLIRLIKYWNNIKDHELKSYLIERLVEKIFQKKPMNTWGSTVKIFFQDSIYMLRNRIKLENKVYTHQSILEEYSDIKFERMIVVLQEAVRHAQEEDWIQLFEKF